MFDVPPRNRCENTCGWLCFRRTRPSVTSPFHVLPGPVTGAFELARCRTKLCPAKTPGTSGYDRAGRCHAEGALWASTLAIDGGRARPPLVGGAAAHSAPLPREWRVSCFHSRHRRGPIKAPVGGGSGFLRVACLWPAIGVF